MPRKNQRCQKRPKQEDDGSYVTITCNTKNDHIVQQSFAPSEIHSTTIRLLRNCLFAPIKDKSRTQTTPTTCQDVPQADKLQASIWQHVLVRRHRASVNPDFTTCETSRRYSATCNCSSSRTTQGDFPCHSSNVQLLTELQSSTDQAYAGLNNYKRSSVDDKRSGFAEQSAQPGVLGQMWNNFTKGK